MPCRATLLLGTAVLMTCGAMAPVQMTADQDHRHLMDLLHIDHLRQGADGNNKSAPNYQNFDEAKASPYTTLPDVLTLADGTKVTTPAQWWEKRRPEVVELFDREIYGRVPAETPRVTWEVTGETKGNVGGYATVTKQLVGHVDNAACPEIKVDIQASLTVPAEVSGPVPVMVEFGFSFGGRGFGAGGRRPTTGAGAATRPNPQQRPGGFGGGPGGGPQGPSWQEQVLSKGWGYAILTPTSVQADNGAGLTQGIIGLCNKGQPRKPDDWGALRAWAWGLSRLIDYLETDKAVDAKQVGIEGLSRYGKATIVAMAYEPRLAIAFVGSSGQGGAKIMRRNFGEQVENVAGAGEYHWMAGNYIRYAGPLTPNDLPVDSHELVAMCAPRPVLISVGSLNVEGTWIDAVGNFLGGAYASPVYELLGKKGMGTMTMPPEGTAVIDGDVAFRQHNGGHTTGPNWPTFLQFADRYIKGPTPPPKKHPPAPPAP